MSGIRLLTYSVVAIEIALALYVLFQNRFVWDRGARFFRAYIVVAAATELLMVYVSREGASNALIGQFFTLFQYGLLAFGNWIWIEGIWGKRLLGILLLLLGFWFIYRSYWFINNGTYDGSALAMQSVLLVFVSGLALYGQTRNTQQFLLSNHRFWFTSATLLYFSITSILFFVHSRYVLTSVTVASVVQIVNNFMTLLANVFFLAAIQCLPRKKISS